MIHKKKIVFAGLLLSLLLMLPQAEARDEGYLMTPGDVLDISVAEQEDLQEDNKRHGYMVRPDGMVDFPMVGTIDTKGLTIEEFTAELEVRLSRYFVDPKVSVNIVKLGTVRVHVLGEVSKPGTYELTKSHRLADAIGAAQGFTRDTAKKKIFLIHKNQEGEPVKINLNDLLKKGDVSQNVELAEDDILNLTRNGRIDFSRDILPFISGTYMIDNIVNNHDYGSR
ncbi:polysaccharide biosynthesis/export family protein [Selenomonas sp. KH1T6]|uniref:polysaccharide biosynthesis/export family protein n=1 Tax=Selenomonas sp. KH1T6 TaxID=3158784 RepID=UPI0008A77559|nr:polysaccharide export outer membrane protein [Selenomonas ruminantium]